MQKVMRLMVTDKTDELRKSMEMKQNIASLSTENSRLKFNIGNIIHTSYIQPPPQRSTKLLTRALGYTPSTFIS